MVSNRCVTTNPLGLLHAKGDWPFCITAWAHLFRRDFIGEMRFIPGILFEDYPFVISLLKKHPKTVILSDRLYYYLICRPDSILGRSALNFTSKHIESYRVGLLSIADYYSDASEEDKKNIREKVFPRFFKHIHKTIPRQQRVARAPLYAAFAKLLLDLKNRGMFTHRGRRLRYYLFYRYLMWRYSK